MKLKLVLHIIFILLSIFIFVFVVNPLIGIDGFHVDNSNFIYCKYESACMHEIGHFIDNKSNNPSNSKEFFNAIISYDRRILPFIYSNKSSEVEWQIFQTIQWIYQQDPNNYRGVVSFIPTKEIYAEIYMIVGGDRNRIPREFKEFYK
jgi:hypothetical protein